MAYSVDIRHIDLSASLLPIQPPGFTRLEPQSVSGDPAPGVRAAIHDPLWLLLRQWQFGEFAGDDAGQPLSVAMTSTEIPVSATVAGDPKGTVAAQRLDAATLLDPIFESEPPGDPGTRARAEAGATLKLMLAEAGHDVPDLAQLYAFGTADIEATPRGLRTLVAASPDAAAAALAIEATTPPAWLASAAPAALAAAEAWLAWYRRNISPLTANPAWVRERLEYRFAVAAGEGAGQKVFKAPMHLGGEIDWFGFDLASGLTLDPPPARSIKRDFSPSRRLPEDRRTLATPLRFGGMPSDRLWEFEDANVSFGAMDVQANDPARLCLIEFATVFSNDWFITPLDTSAAAFTTVDSLTVVDSFGIETVIPRADDSGKAGRFRLFEISGDDDTSIPGILTLPTARHTTEGTPLESVHFLRDEAANMAWAVEHIVQTRAGLPRNRGDEALAARTRPPLAPGADLRYILETDVPRHWIPLVPVGLPEKTGGFILRKGTLTGTDDSAGRVLAGTKVDFFDEEIPRGGIRVMRIPSLARRPDGSLARWVALRTSDGNSNGTSQLAFDETIRY